MNSYNLKTKITLLVDSIVVEESETNALEVMNKLINDSIETEINKLYIEDFDIETEVVSKDEVPENFTVSHRRLLECGYPMDQLKQWSDEDAEAEIDAIY